MNKKNERSGNSSIRCQVCGKNYSPQCDWQQGRCPLRTPMLDLDQDIFRRISTQWMTSVCRIAAGISLIWPQSMALAGIFLIAAEIFNTAKAGNTHHGNQ